MDERQKITGDQIDRAIEKADKAVSVVERISGWFKRLFKKK